MGTNEYRILLIEDTDTDAELIMREVRKTFPDVIFKRVETREAFIDNLQHFSPDVILSDFHLPVFDGLTALKITLELKPQVPFIIVTGTISEEVAVDCMKAGATDYILKDSPRRLGAAITNALEQSKLKKESLLAEEAIIQERNLLRTLIDHLPDTIYVKDVEGRKIVANKADMEAMKVTYDADFVGKTDLELYPGIDGECGYNEDLHVINNGETLCNIEGVFLDKNGNKQLIETAKFPLTDKNGKIIGLVGVGRNITEKRENEEKILLLSNGIEQSPLSIVITDLKGNMQYLNPKTVEATGFSHDEMLGQNSSMFQSGQTSSETYKDLWDTISTGKIWKGTLCNKKKNGIRYWESMMITPIKNPKGEISNFMAIKEDITLKRQMEHDLVEAKEKAEESDRLKSAFLANMSHEIRTPLNSIMGFSELLTEPGLSDEERGKYAAVINLNGENLLSIINDIIDFSRIEAGEVNIEMSETSSKIIIDELFTDYEQKIKQKDLDFIIGDQCQPTLLYCDKVRVKQILGNYLNNAIKFTTKGSIELGSCLYEKQIQFYVKDTGIGIAPEHHKIIFKRFRQIETAYTREHGGNGLGLPIAKHLAHVLDGSIDVESEPGKGATFYLNLPIAESTI
jgi:PAS domain S-box-containing protein